MLYGPIVPRLLALGSWFPVLGPRQDGSGATGQVSCSKMGNFSSYGEATKPPAPSQASFIEPETLSYQITLFGPIGADVRHPLTSKIYLKSCK